MDINYDKIQKSINEYGNYILDCIKDQYKNSLTQEQLQNINNLRNTQFIIIEKPSKEDIEFFSKQDGVNDPENYNVSHVPSAHGGRTKGDNKIHIYPYTKSFSDCKTEKEIIKACMDDIVVHEIFHYFIRPNLSNDDNPLKDEFGHFLTEGFVQYYTEYFAKKYRFGNPKSNYDKNVEFVKKLISSFPKDMSQSQIDKIIFTCNQEELLEISQNGKHLYQEYISDLQFQRNLSSFIIDMGSATGIDKEDGSIKHFISYYKKISDLNVIFDELSKSIDFIFKDSREMKNRYMKKLRNLISDKKLKKEMLKYEEQMKTFLPMEEQVNKLRRNGMSLEKIKSTLKTDNNIFEYVPDVLYHGSPENLKVINPGESTQRGRYVYATDNPVHALFFSIFRNSSIARAHIKEYINENGDYKVKYQIDERVAGALDDIISDRDITIHVCNGKQFFKPQGEQYISREWISKDGQSIVPIDRIKVNVKHFFESLEKQGLVEYSKYEKSKDWKTVMDLLGQNYPFGLGTERAKNIQEFDSMYDEFIETNFPEQFKFSKQFRYFIKEVMAMDYKLEDPNISVEEENDYKLKLIKNITDSFFLVSKDEQGKIKYDIDMNKINLFLNQNNTIKEKKGKSL